MQGLVIKSTGSWYTVEDGQGVRYECRIKGKLRMKGLVSTNPVAVGDIVDFEPEPDLETAVISKVHDRKNYIIRKSINLSKQVQIIAANLDLACLVVTLAAPRTSIGFIDRFLVTAEAYGVPAVLIFNKLDLFSKEGLEILDNYIDLYQGIGYPCYSVSATEDLNIETLEILLKDKISLFSGHSGVGKSSLINRLIPGKELKTGKISDWSEMGKHTTTFAELFDLPFGGKLIDTPGIRELGITDIEKHELGHFFPEMRALMHDCKFNNCVHINEPGCAVLKALEEGDLEPTRYDSYQSIYFGNDTRH
ncbi:MAG TPA: ribosome small subunit-dependent GTPase A [Pelobium sp.]|nr:ribosome small subunit-dependent GTPase A [Pelobium sp.]